MRLGICVCVFAATAVQSRRSKAPNLGRGRRVRVFRCCALSRCGFALRLGRGTTVLIVAQRHALGGSRWNGSAINLIESHTDSASYSEHLHAVASRVSSKHRLPHRLQGRERGTADRAPVQRHGIALRKSQAGRGEYGGRTQVAVSFPCPAV